MAGQQARLQGLVHALLGSRALQGTAAAGHSTPPSSAALLLGLLPCWVAALAQPSTASRALPPASWLQYLSAVLLLRALRRSRVPPRLHLPTGDELRSLSGTFGILTVFYAAKNFSYLLLQVGPEAGQGGAAAQQAHLLPASPEARLHCMQPSNRQGVLIVQLFVYRSLLMRLLAARPMPRRARRRASRPCCWPPTSPSGPFGASSPSPTPPWNRPPWPSCRPPSAQPIGRRRRAPCCCWGPPAASWAAAWLWASRRWRRSCLPPTRRCGAPCSRWGCRACWPCCAVAWTWPPPASCLA